MKGGKRNFKDVIDKLRLTAEQRQSRGQKLLGEGQGEDAYRHQCLVRWVLRKRVSDADGAREWLDKWDEKHRGSRLREDVIAEWKLGNRGQHLDWRSGPAVAPVSEHVLADVPRTDDSEQDRAHVSDRHRGAGGDAVVPEVWRPKDQGNDCGTSPGQETPGSGQPTQGGFGWDV